MTEATLSHRERFANFVSTQRMEVLKGLGAVSAAAIFALSFGKSDQAEASPYRDGDAPAGYIGAETGGYDAGVQESSIITAEKTAAAAEGDLTGPVVQFFEASSGDLPAVDREVMESISGVQTYLQKRGNGTRLRVATTDGKYDVPILKIDGGGSWDQILRSATDEIQKKGYDTQNDMTIVFLSKDTPQPLTCGLSDSRFPEKVAVESLRDACFSGRYEGFSAVDVSVLQHTLFISKAGKFVGDSLDTMRPSTNDWLWYNSYLNHSKQYTDTLASSKFFQSRVLAPKPAGGNIAFSPTPDRCEVDCGDGYLFPTQTRVQITANPTAGMKFKEWTGACAEDQDNVCDITTSNLQPTQLGAVFEKSQDPPPPPVKYKLRVKPAGQVKAAKLLIKGTGIKCPTDCVEMRPKNSNERLTATTTKGYKVVWKKCGSVTGNVCRVRMTSAKTVEASAVKKPLAKKKEELTTG